MRATDEFGEYDVLDMFNPFQDDQENPTRTDARHRITVNGTWSPGAGVKISPIFRYRSKTPFNVITGVDGNRDGLIWDLPAGVRTLNSGRGADFAQLDVRVAKSFALGGRSRIELIGEAFNVFNDTNPTTFVASQTSTLFGRPTRFAGDFRQTEQRLFQLGLRFEF